MTDYENLISVPDDGPSILTITGDPGTGKTTLAATLPKAIFIRAEDGLKSVPKEKRPAAFPVLKSVDELWEQLTYLVKAKHDYRTVVVDSGTVLDTMFGDQVMDDDEKERGKRAMSLTQACGGYMGGYKAVGAMHGRLRQAAEVLRERRGMNVCFICHSEVSKVDPPDGDPYSRYDLRLSKYAVTHYVDNVDMVAYLRLETYLKGDKNSTKKKAMSDGTRIAVCHTGPAQVSKNRYGITEPVTVELGVNPFPFIN